MKESLLLLMFTGMRVGSRILSFNTYIYNRGRDLIFLLLLYSSSVFPVKSHPRAPRHSPSALHPYIRCGLLVTQCDLTNER